MYKPVNKGIRSCLRCGHTWKARNAVTNVCPNKKCQSPYWNRPLKGSDIVDNPAKTEPISTPVALTPVTTPVTPPIIKDTPVSHKRADFSDLPWYKVNRILQNSPG